MGKASAQAEVATSLVAFPGMACHCEYSPYWLEIAAVVGFRLPTRTSQMLDPMPERPIDCLTRS